MELFKRYKNGRLWFSSHPRWLQVKAKRENEFPAPKLSLSWSMEWVREISLLMPTKVSSQGCAHRELIIFRLTDRDNFSCRCPSCSGIEIKPIARIYQSEGHRWHWQVDISKLVDALGNFYRQGSQYLEFKMSGGELTGGHSEKISWFLTKAYRNWVKIVLRKWCHYPSNPSQISLSGKLTKIKPWANCPYFHIINSQGAVKEVTDDWVGGWFQWWRNRYLVTCVLTLNCFMVSMSSSSNVGCSKLEITILMVPFISVIPSLHTASEQWLTYRKLLMKWGGYHYPYRYVWFPLYKNWYDNEAGLTARYSSDTILQQGLSMLPFMTALRVSFII